MLKIMLESVNGLLEEAAEAKTMKARLTFIVCAQHVLEKCIESLDNKTATYVSEFHEASAEELKRIKTKTESPEYEIRVDAKKLVKIVGANGEEAPLDMPMEIDGKVTTYGEAIGKSFNQGRFL